MTSSGRTPRTFTNFFTDEPREGYGEPASQHTAQTVEFDSDAARRDDEDVQSQLAA